METAERRKEETEGREEDYNEEEEEGCVALLATKGKEEGRQRAFKLN